MAENIYFLLILCGILCLHQIFADESSDHLVHKKRVINLEPGEDVPSQIGDAPYLANIRKTAGHVVICEGAILSKHTVITVANCVASLDATGLEVLIGSVYSHLGVHYTVIMKLMRFGNHESGINDGIGMLTVEPAIIFTSRVSVIQLYQGPLTPDTPATIFGWGYNPSVPRGTDFRSKLRSITVPIMNHTDCVNFYRRNHIVISNNDICTFHPNKRCGHTDAGAPLVVHNRLAGLYLWRMDNRGCVGPDIFINLQSSEYASWIRDNIIYNVLHVRGTHA